MLKYDPQRLSTLARRTGEAIEHLDGTGCADPEATDAVASIRGVSHTLSTTWMPVLARIGCDTSMTSWSTQSSAEPVDVAGWDGSDSGPSGFEDLSDEALVDLFDPANRDNSVSVVPAAIPSGALVELARRWDELDPGQQQQAILHLLARAPGDVGTLEVFTGRSSLAFIEGTLDDLVINPQFAAAVMATVAEVGEVPPELQPLVDRIGVAYADVLVAGLNGIDDPTQHAGLGLDVPFTLGPAAAASFVRMLDDATRATIESTQLLDTTEFTLSDSVLAMSADGTHWGEATAFYGEGRDANYEGGGFVVGPDNEEYPIVIPTVVTTDGTYTADNGTTPGEPSVANLGGADEGWTTVGYASGIERFQEAPSGLELAAGAVAATTGLVGPLPPSTGLPYIAMSPNRPPHLTDEPPTLPTTQDVPYADGAPLLAAQTTVAVLNMDNQSHRAYQAVFEENADGRRRARIETFTLWTDDDGDIVIVPEHVFVDADGDLMSQQISYGQPFAHPDANADGADAPVYVPDLNLTGYDYMAFPVYRPTFP